jgi:hypothetical protein
LLRRRDRQLGPLLEEADDQVTHGEHAGQLVVLVDDDQVAEALVPHDPGCFLEIEGEGDGLQAPMDAVADRHFGDVAAPGDDAQGIAVGDDAGGSAVLHDDGGADAPLHHPDRRVVEAVAFLDGEHCPGNEGSDLHVGRP